MDSALTTSELRAVFGWTSDSSARMQIHRWGLQAVGRDVTTGQKYWPITEIIEAAGGRTVAGRQVRDVIAEVIRRRSLPGDGST